MSAMLCDHMLQREVEARGIWELMQKDVFASLNFKMLRDSLRLMESAMKEAELDEDMKIRVLSKVISGMLPGEADLTYRSEQQRQMLAFFEKQANPVITVNVESVRPWWQ